MALFPKNSNEAAYVGGKKHWVDVIKNTGPGGLLIWRQPEEDFNTNSTVIVMPGEQAIFVKGGNIEQVFESGTYKLSTDNYPFISRLRTAFSGGISTFNCVVYFVRTAHSLELRWGTSSPIQVRDTVLGVATKLGARGAYKVSVKNPAIFLEKMIGSNVMFETQDGLYDYFAEQFQTKIRSSIAKSIMDANVEILGIDARLDEISELTAPKIDEIVSDYGLKCESFVISAIDIIDDGGLRARFDAIGIDAYQEQRMAVAKATGQAGAMDTLGMDRWALQQSADILGKVAENPGAGGIASAGAGLGMGLGTAGVFANMTQALIQPLNNSYNNGMMGANNMGVPGQMGQQALNQGMGSSVDGRFKQQAVNSMPQTGSTTTQQPESQMQQSSDFTRQQPMQQDMQPATQQADDDMAKLKKLKDMFDMGFITEQEFTDKKAEILARM